MQDEIIDTENYDNQPKRYLCRHIFTDGHRCGSICLRGEHFCYYHHTTRRPAPKPRERRSRRATFELPLPEDRSAIQAGIGMILQRIASNDIDPRRAGLLLYGLSIAASTLPKAPAKPQRGPYQPEQVEEITTHPDLGALAPQSEFNPPEERLSLAGRLLAELRRKPCACNQQPADNPEDDYQQPSGEPTILPTLNAAAPEIEQSSPHPTAQVPRHTPEVRRNNRHNRNRKPQPRVMSKLRCSNCQWTSRVAELYSSTQEHGARKHVR